MNGPQDLDLLSDGVWTVAPLPAGIITDLNVGLRNAGYERFAQFGDSESGFVDTEIALEVYRRDEHPRFLFVIIAPDGYELVAADRVPDAMTLVAQWVPAVQASASAAMFTALADDEDRSLTAGLARVLRQGMKGA